MLKCQSIKEQIRQLLKENDGYILKDINNDNKIYNIKPFKLDKKNIEDITIFYTDFYINSMVISCTPMTKQAMKQKVEKIVQMQKESGLSYWKIYQKNIQYPVGIFGFSYMHDKKDKIEMTYMSRLGNIIRPICKIIIPMAFEYLDIPILYGETLSYNIASQIIGKQMGMVENNISECLKNYTKDSYLTEFKIDKAKYNEIKQQNNGEYILTQDAITKVPLKAIHPRARTLGEALKHFKENNQLSRYKHCLKVLKYIEERYPYLFKIIRII
jgi:RimJ/RimL family protein N-acetyltransferase